MSGINSPPTAGFGESLGDNPREKCKYMIIQQNFKKSDEDQSAGVVSTLLYGHLKTVEKSVGFAVAPLRLSPAVRYNPQTTLGKEYGKGPGRMILESDPQSAGRGVPWQL